MDKKINFYLYIVIFIIIYFIFIIKNKYDTFQNTQNDDYKIINTIPNNVFLIFISSSTLDLPEKMNINLEMNKKNNPEFNFYVYDEEKGYKFIKDNIDDSIANIFNKIKPGAYKADLLRYCLLYINGGVYMDIKWKLNVKLIDLINKYGEIYVKDPDWYPDSCKRGCNNGFIISKAKNPILLDCINQIKENFNNNYYGKNSLYPTGPCLLGYIIRSKYNHIEYKLKVSESQSPYTINDIDDNIIVSSYPNYRDELSKYGKTKHYVSMWNEKDIYTE